MTLGIDGLVSGLDTTSLINSLMQAEAVPQTLLKNKVTAAQAAISALQGLNTQLADLTTLASNTAKPQALDLYTATSSSPNVTASTSAGAAAGSIDITVDRLAQTQVSVSAALAAWPDSSLTLTAKDGTATTITPASASLDDVVTAINGSAAGVTALKVASGTDPVSGTVQYRLQLTATKAGAAGGFTVSGTSAQITDIRSAQDAQLTLWAGTAAAQPITSASNTFTDLLPGVSVTVSAASTDPVSVTVARDDNRVSKSASDLVSALNNIFAVITNRSSITTATDATGATTIKGGAFTGDSTIRDVNQKLLAAASAPVDGHSPSEYGISITRSGTMEFDAAKFSAALAKNPAGTKAAVQAIAGRIADAAGQASDKYTGLITTRITGQQSEVKGLSTQIDDWDGRLATRRASLQQTYSALEVQLSALQSQSSWLTSQLGSLPKAST